MNAVHRYHEFMVCILQVMGNLNFKILTLKKDTPKLNNPPSSNVTNEHYKVGSLSKTKNNNRIKILTHELQNIRLRNMFSTLCEFEHKQIIKNRSLLGQNNDYSSFFYLLGVSKEVFSRGRNKNKLCVYIL